MLRSAKETKALLARNVRENQYERENQSKTTSKYASQQDFAEIR